jgi:hypothetical protein
MLVSNLLLGSVTLYAVIRKIIFIIDAVKEKNNSRLKAEIFFLALVLLISGLIITLTNII